MSEIVLSDLAELEETDMSTLTKIDTAMLAAAELNPAARQLRVTIR